MGPRQMTWGIICILAEAVAWMKNAAGCCGHKHGGICDAKQQTEKGGPTG